MSAATSMPFGAAPEPAGGVRFALWAPSAAHVTVEWAPQERPEEMRTAPLMRDASGWHRTIVSEARPGDRYRFRMPDGLAVPDPASLANPDDVHGMSQVVDSAAHAWRDGGWRGRPWSEAVVYELHLGTFTPEGTYAAAAARLPALAELGITAIELMPLADFPGRRNWGYDGVLPFAPDAVYGPPDALKAFVDAAHALHMMVLVDVVYNHFGPDGNYLHAYCPEFFNPAHRTPWGAAINFDGPQASTVRDFFVANALHWIREFHADGLRMDAVHAIRDDSGESIVREICRALRAGPGRDRHVHVVLENEANSAALLARDEDGMPLVATAQWNDDFHHAMHVLLTGERDGYYADYAAAPLAALGRSLAEGFVYQGEPSPYRDGEPRGEPSAALPPTVFVSSLQTHDQVGNRAFGERIAMLADPALLDAAYACLLLAPHVPMLFMGEEFDASTPFFYFCDFGGDLGAAVTEGRRAEFGRFPAFADPLLRERIPDPNDPATFTASTLRWDERERAPHAHRLALVRELLRVRRQLLVPRLAGAMRGGSYAIDGALVAVVWTLGDGSRWHIAANFGDARSVPAPHPTAEIAYQHDVDATGRIARGGVRVWLEAGAHG